MDIPLHVLKHTTKGFSDETKIRSGAYGQVYKGIYNGEEIAVEKWTHHWANLDEKQFKSQFLKVMRLKHPNVVRLVGYGYSSRKDSLYYGELHYIDRYLCFEYLQGGSLDKHFYESREHDWGTSYNVIKDICEGLNFFHGGCGSEFFHLDLRPENILLDGNMVAKIAHFGVSRLFGETHTNGTQTHCHIVQDGTYIHSTDTMGGKQSWKKYVAPEFRTKRQISQKNDVFSLGVIIIEIMTGPLGYDEFCQMDDATKFLELKTSAYLPGESDQVKACMEIAVKCVDHERDNRPTVAEIVHMLNETEIAIIQEAGNGAPAPTGEGWDLASDLELPNEEFDSHEFTNAYRDGMDITHVTHNVLEDILRDEGMEATNVPLALLQDITENFSHKRKIGSGGFGVVYKGILRNGSVAVKKFLDSRTLEDGPFYKEANFLLNVKHPNIVRFLGFCAHTENEAMKLKASASYNEYIYPERRERLLCFEYISGGSLDNHLADELRGLEWHTRYQIIKGICEGLEYLHKEMRIAHMDLKPPNVLLDDLMVPKITDFGISRHLDGTHAVTKGCAMSFGYCAPEYIRRGKVSFKSDIYSLGFIITELVTGRKGETDIKNVLRRWRYRWNKSANYPPLGYQQVTGCIEIAELCMSESPERRPSISDIIRVLNEMGSANEHTSNADEPTVGPISRYSWELLEFDKLELHFPFELNKQIPCSLELTNERDDYIAFDIKTTSILQYQIEPNKGIMSPRSNCNIFIALQPQKRVPDGLLCKDDFDVRCVIVNEGLKAENITKDLFEEQSGNVVDEVKLTVNFSALP